MEREYPFIMGAQYYRAPTPDKSQWRKDLSEMRELGFNAVKFWVQWRWSNRREGEFYFDDIDELMDIAAQNNLKVTLNVIFDGAPNWLYKKYPDSKQVTSSGVPVEPQTVVHRQLGGFPGPCYQHGASRQARMEFLTAVVTRYRNHPAMAMWDVWNEPEQCGIYRRPDFQTLTCYCPACREAFITRLKKRYQSIDNLNQVWGKCYIDWDDIELPKNGATFADFIEFREFHLDVMTAEANWRLNLVKHIDQVHPVYLHVVPNTSKIFNAITGVDDFALAENCDVFASTNFPNPIWSVLSTSAAGNKICYNVECHIGSGSITMHPKRIFYRDLLNDFIPQIGLGIRGFMFWQYRPETLGGESPAWGVTNPDGSEGCIGAAAKEFIKRIQPIEAKILAAKRKKAEIAVWKGRNNEIFSFAAQNSLDGFAAGIEAYVNALYNNNFPCEIIDDSRIITKHTAHIKLLIMPACYAISHALYTAVDSFIKNGGVLLCEAHFGGYDTDAGRHSYQMPGLGANKQWGINEQYTTSAYHLKNTADNSKLDTDGLPDDVIKAIEAYGLNGGKYFPVRVGEAYTVIGAERFACVDGDNTKVVGMFDGVPCIVSKNYGKGKIIYCGTNLGEGAALNPLGLEHFLMDICAEANIAPTAHTVRGVHIDIISDQLIAVNNTTAAAVDLNFGQPYKSVFYENSTDNNNTISIPANTADILTEKPGI